MGIPLNIDWQQILLHLLNFAILALGLYLLLYKPVKNFVKKRRDHYLEMDSQAAKKLADAEKAESEYKARLDSADAEAAEKAAAQFKEAEKAAAMQLETAKAQSEKLLADARAAAKAERKKILEGARDEITQIAVAATEKLLEENSTDIYEQFLDAAGKERKDG